MQQLHLVGFTTDHKGLILGTRRGTDEGSYVVTLDRALVEQIEDLLRLQAGEGTGDSAKAAAGNGTGVLLRRPKIESRLTPRQVQSLLRTGRSVSEVAEEAGMSEDWVGRFAPPVLAEQARVIERATGLTYTKPRIGPSIQPLGESVIWNLAERGIVLSGPAVEDAWSAFQQPDGGWVVRVSYLAERRRQHADWTIDMAQGALKAVNRLGNELAYVEAGRRRPTALPPATPVSASAQRAAVAPPRPPPTPPSPARPSGRLSLLSSPAGYGRSASSPAAAPAPAGRAAPEPSPAPPPPAPAAPPTPARERRPRPLRPLSAGSSAAVPPVPPAAPSGGGSEEAPQSAAGPASPRPKRERPLRAPSRIRRDELSDAAPTTTRRPVVPPRSPQPKPAPAAPEASASPPAGPNRFGPAHSASERKTSTAERFGIGRPAAGGVALRERPSEPQPAGVASDHGPESDTRVVRRPLRTRPIVIEAELDDDMAYAPDDLVVTDAANDPVTAPVPAVDILDLDSADDLDGAYPGDGVRPQDQVLIRAGQAGAADDPGARRPRPTQRPSAGERQNRVGRRKLRRRAEDTP